MPLTPEQRREIFERAQARLGKPKYFRTEAEAREVCGNCQAPESEHGKDGVEDGGRCRYFTPSDSMAERALAFYLQKAGSGKGGLYPDWMAEFAQQEVDRETERMAGELQEAREVIGHYAENWGCAACKFGAYMCNEHSLNYHDNGGPNRAQAFLAKFPAKEEKAND